MTRQTQSYGQQAVRINENPTDNPQLQDLKQDTASLIDVVFDLKQKAQDIEVQKFCSNAISEFELAVAWATKAITYNELQQNGQQQQEQETQTRPYHRKGALQS